MRSVLSNLHPAGVVLAMAAFAACTSTGPEPGGMEMEWDRTNSQQDLAISDDGLTLSWRTDSEAVWLCSQTTGRFTGGNYSWDFAIESIAQRQIGVGIMLDPPDWGFFRYLGAGTGAWAYDAYEGAIVTKTEAIHSDLPKFQETGIVTVRLNLTDVNTCTFVVNGEETPAIELPAGATIIPAACLLKKGQVVTIRDLRRID